MTVIWGLGLISLLITSFMSSGRLRLQTANNIARAAQAMELAEGGIIIAAHALMAERMTGIARGEMILHDGGARFCRLAEGILAISIEDEGGKVDLNGAAPELLRAALLGAGAESSRANVLAQAITDYRSAAEPRQPGVSYGTRKNPFAPKHALFETIFEIDQVDGIDAKLAERLLPFITVHSHKAGVDPRISPPALYAALTGQSAEIIDQLRKKPFPNRLDRNDLRFPAIARQFSDRDVFAAHVDVLLDSGQIGSREAIADFHNSAVPVIRELRRSNVRYEDEMRRLRGEQTALPPC